MYPASEIMNAYAHIAAVQKVVHHFVVMFVDADDGCRRKPGDNTVIVDHHRPRNMSGLAVAFHLIPKNQAQSKDTHI